MVIEKLTSVAVLIILIFGCVPTKDMVQPTAENRDMPSSKQFTSEWSPIASFNIKKFQEKSKTIKRIALKVKEKYEALKGKLYIENSKLIQMREMAKADPTRRQELKDQEKHYTDLKNKYAKMMKDTDRKATLRVLKDLEDIVVEIGKARDYEAIIEKNVSLQEISDKYSVGLIYYKEPLNINKINDYHPNGLIDITDEVVEIYDKIEHGDYHYFEQQ